jgi:hypothetical protein
VLHGSIAVRDRIARAVKPPGSVGVRGGSWADSETATVNTRPLSAQRRWRGSPSPAVTLGRIIVARVVRRSWLAIEMKELASRRSPRVAPASEIRGPGFDPDLREAPEPSPLARPPHPGTSRGARGQAEIRTDGSTGTAAEFHNGDARRHPSRTLSRYSRSRPRFGCPRPVSSRRARNLVGRGDHAGQGSE